MAVNVRLGSSGVRRVTTTAPTTKVRLNTSVTNPSQTQTATRIDGLQGVDVAGVEDGHTLVYDAASGNWVAEPLTSADVKVNSIDGGTY